MIILIILLNLLLLFYLFIKNKGIKYIFSKKIFRYLIFVGIVAIIIFVVYGLEFFLNTIMSGLFQGQYKIVSGMIVWNDPMIGLLYNFIIYFLFICN